MSKLALFLRITYRTFYSLLHVLLIALLLVSPGDIITQSIDRSNKIPIVIVAASYVATISFVIFVYATRLYINKSVLKSIPKSWIPIEKGDVHKHVRKMIVMNLSRSAAIVFASKPHVAPPAVPGSMEGPVEEQKEEQGEGRRKSFQLLRLKKTATMEEEMGISLPPHKPVWGEIEHKGWASPESSDLPNLQYASVISELPNLIEAKALTLAPPDPTLQSEPPMLDPEAVSLLQRPVNMGLREYLANLVDLGVLEPSPAITDFNSMYEYARFSTKMISNTRFRELMHNFAEILRNMEPFDPTVFDEANEDDSAPSESDIDNDAPMGTNPTTPRSQRTRESSISRSLSTGGGGSIAPPKRPPLQGRNSSTNTWQQYRTAPTTPKSRRTAVSRSSLSRSSSINSFAQTRQPFPLSSQPSSASLRSASSGGSVIRLSDRREAGDLPYVLTVTDPSDRGG